MTAMNQQAIFPAQAMTEDPGSAIKIEGHKVVFDKKVSFLPVDIKKENIVDTKVDNGKSHRQRGS